MKATNSLERVLAVLQVFTEDRLEWTPEELMDELGYSRPTLYRYLKTLKDAGLLTSMPNAGFTLGPKVVEMDYLLRKSDPLVLAAEPYLNSLSGEYPCTALLVRWYGNKILCVDSRSSVGTPQSSYARGRPMPLLRGAIARSIIAFLPRRRLLPILEDNFDELKAIGLGQTVEEIQVALKKVKRAGVAVAKGEVTQDVVGIASPVFDSGQSPIASLCITIAAGGVDQQAIDTISAEVRHAASEISARLVQHRSRSAAQ
ncbi:IclR family transcriptional regulator [Pararhizobium haloflavum]|uniref:IclR family transcriptional regulator n=1 Tax=Pararhizobium haloflavum TaxID=2037914 RepID=UPI000C180B19|nr:IclR family transcriptional regulator [Pararhizobium haloflavum]